MYQTGGRSAALLPAAADAGPGRATTAGLLHVPSESAAPGTREAGPETHDPPVPKRGGALAIRGCAP